MFDSINLYKSSKSSMEGKGCLLKVIYLQINECTGRCYAIVHLFRNKHTIGCIYTGGTLRYMRDKLKVIIS